MLGSMIGVDWRWLQQQGNLRSITLFEMVHCFVPSPPLQPGRYACFGVSRETVGDQTRAIIWLRQVT